jgi:hypothetical protein
MATFAEDHINHHAKYLFQGKLKLSDDSYSKGKYLTRLRLLVHLSVHLYSTYQTLPRKKAVNMCHNHRLAGRNEVRDTPPFDSSSSLSSESNESVAEYDGIFSIPLVLRSESNDSVAECDGIFSIRLVLCSESNDSAAEYAGIFSIRLVPCSESNDSVAEYAGIFSIRLVLYPESNDSVAEYAGIFPIRLVPCSESNDSVAEYAGIFSIRLVLYSAAATRSSSTASDESSKA